MPPRGLKSLLTYVIRSPSFAESDTLIHTGGEYPWRAKNLLVHFEKAEPDKRPHLYWGMISSASKDMNWLNTSGRDNVSIPIEAVRDTILQAYGITDHEELAGAHAIVFGWCRKSKNGKLYISILDDDPHCIYIKLNELLQARSRR